MFNYFNRIAEINRFLFLLRIDHGMDRYPTLSFKYKLDEDLLTIELPSNKQYMLSFLDEPTTITFNLVTQKVTITPDPYGIVDSSKLLNHLKKCVSFLKERESFIHMVYSERNKMAKYIDPRHKRGGNRTRDKDGNVYSDFVYAASDDSNNDDSSGSSHDNHSGHSGHHDN